MKEDPEFQRDPLYIFDPSHIKHKDHESDFGLFDRDSDRTDNRHLLLHYQPGKIQGAVFDYFFTLPFFTLCDRLTRIDCPSDSCISKR
jgi:hypothetical protein